MVKAVNLHLYEGKGVPIAKRGLEVPEFEPLIGTDDPKNYNAEEGLRHAVNVALALGQPLLVTGEPGTGKTQLAGSIAYELGLHEPLIFYTKTTSTAADLFYHYDALGRFQDIQLKTPKSVGEYITYQALGIAILLAKQPHEVNRFLPEAFRGRGPTRSVVLIDEIDKAPRDLPNDILNEIEGMSFTVKETGATFSADQRYRPILVLTSNSEKNLPDAFLRRCVFYHIPFPNNEQLKTILRKRFGDHPEFTEESMDASIQHFNEIRKKELKKKPATAEFLAWFEVIQSLKVTDPEHPTPAQAEFLSLSYSVLAKNQEDLLRLKKDIARKMGE